MKAQGDDDGAFFVWLADRQTTTPIPPIPHPKQQHKEQQQQQEDRPAEPLLDENPDRYCMFPIK